MCAVYIIALVALFLGASPPHHGASKPHHLDDAVAALGVTLSA